METIPIDVSIGITNSFNLIQVAIIIGAISIVLALLFDFTPLTKEEGEV